jgi:hypothetical protein
MSHSATAKAGLLSRLPLVGPIARAVDQDINLIFYLLVIALTLLVLAVKLWGLVALTMVALAAVPCMFAFFIAISWP